MPKTVDVRTRRNEFVDASAAVIAQDGLSGATMRRVAQYAGCTTGALTHYFSSRNELLIATLFYVHENAKARMMLALKENTTPSETLQLVLVEALPLDGNSLKEWRVWLAFWSAAMDDADLAQENTRRYTQWRELIARLLRPLVSTAELESEVTYVVALVDGLGVGVVRQSPDGRRRRQAQREAKDAMRRYLQRFSGLRSVG